VLHRTRDGDTPEVKLPGGALVWAIRLLNCWCPELHRGTTEQKEIGRLAWVYANNVLEKSDDLYWHIPFSKDINVDGLNILQLATFDRLLGYLYVGTSQTLNQMLVDKGLASTTKNGELGT